MKKVLTVFMLLCAVCLYSNGQEINLKEKPEDEPIGGEGGKSLTDSISAYLEVNFLAISLTSVTPLQVFIINQSTNQTVYSDSFASTTQVIIDLEDEGIGEGSYLLRIYAFGKWWWGEFVLEE